MSDTVTHAHAKEHPEKPPRPGGHKRPSHLSLPISRGGRYVRIDWRFMGSRVLSRLKDSEFRALLALASYVANWRHDVNPDGTFPLHWHTFAHYSRLGASGIGRVTKRHVARFIELGLLEDFIDGQTGDEYLRFADWRSLVAGDPTGAERAARWRERHGIYGRRERRPGDPLPAKEIAPHHELEERAS